jgi:hypothetical protein
VTPLSAPSSAVICGVYLTSYHGTRVRGVNFTLISFTRVDGAGSTSSSDLRRGSRGLAVRDDFHWPSPWSRHDETAM